MNKRLKKKLFRILADDNTLLEKLDDFSLDNLWIWSIPDIQDFWVNRGYCEMLSFPSDEIPRESSVLSGLVYESDLQKVNSAIETHITQETPLYDVVIRMKDYNGVLGWYRSRGIFSGNPKTKSGYLIGSTTPLASSEKIETIFRKTIDASAEAIYVLVAHYVDYKVKDFIIRDINQKAEVELSMPRKDLIGGKINELFPINLENGYFERYKEAFLSRKPFRQEYTIPEGYPGTGDYESHVVPYNDGVIIYNRDLTQLVKTQEELEKAQEEIEDLDIHYQSVISTQSVYIFKTNIEGDFTYINEYFLKDFGFRRESLLGTNLFVTVFQLDQEESSKVLSKCVTQPNIFHPVILKTINEEGRLISGKWEFKGLLNVQGNLSEILCVGFDITEQVEALEKAHELISVTKDQNERLRSFAYIVSHNIRSHSANIEGLADLLVDVVGRDESIYLGMLQQSAAMLNRTINHLNQILSIQMSTEQLKKEIDLKDEVKRTLTIFEKQITDIKGTIKINIPNGFVINFVPAYIESVLLNLISNAIKYRQFEKELMVKIDAGITDGKKYFCVVDNGQGLDLEKYGDELFGMYKTFHGNEDALGFGLFLTRSQIEALDGRIEVKSEVGAGTCFKVWLND